jgi:hypothetical protein
MSTSRQTLLSLRCSLIGHEIISGGIAWRVAYLVHRLVWMLAPEGTKCFVGDLPEQERKVVWATHYAPGVDLLQQQPKVDGIAWKSKPTWLIVAKDGRTVHPDLRRFVAKRMGATIVETNSRHVIMLSHPDLVVDVRRHSACGQSRDRAACRSSKCSVTPRAITRR